MINRLAVKLDLGKKLALAVTGTALLILPLLIGIVSAPRMRAQSPQVSASRNPDFEVASVKFNKSGQLAMRSGAKGRTYTAINTPLRYLIAAAYRIPAARVLGGPDWVGAASVDMRFIGGDRFDISAKLPENTRPDQVPSVLRALLSDRFKLIVHPEAREAPIYTLVMARKDERFGSQLRRASIDCEAEGTAAAPPDAAAVAIPERKPEEQGHCQMEIGGEILGRGQRLSALARALALFTDRPVLDKTGLIGGFDFELRFPELNTPAGAVGPPDPAIGLFTALEEQLGLKLESAKGSVDVVVIDHVERPTEN